MKTILDKINKADEIQAKKVELGTHEVELSIVTDFEKAYNEALDMQAKAETNIINYNELAKSIQNVLNQAGQKFLRANAIYQEIEQMSKDLGVEPSNVIKNKKETISIAIKEIDAYNKKLTSNKVNI
jgi:DNA-binding SARP family transcriptional activator